MGLVEHRNVQDPRKPKLTALVCRGLGINYSFLFMRAEGNHLAEITSLINASVSKPAIDKEFPFEQTNDALTYVESGRAKGKVVIKVK